MDPYALGLLLGDGCLTGATTPSFATDDPELAEALEAALPGVEARYKDGVDYVLNRVREHGEVITLENPVTRSPPCPCPHRHPVLHQVHPTRLPPQHR